MEYKYEQLTDPVWEKIFKPIENHMALMDQGWNNCMYRNDGPQAAYIKELNETKPFNIWSVEWSDDNNIGYLTAGYRNRLTTGGYIVTEVPVEGCHHDVDVYEADDLRKLKRRIAYTNKKKI